MDLPCPSAGWRCHCYFQTHKTLNPSYLSCFSCFLFFKVHYGHSAWCQAQGAGWFTKCVFLSCFLGLGLMSPDAVSCSCSTTVCGQGKELLRSLLELWHLHASVLIIINACVLCCSNALKANDMWTNTIGLDQDPQAGSNAAVEASIYAPSVGGSKRKERQDLAQQLVQAGRGSLCLLSSGHPITFFLAEDEDDYGSWCCPLQLVTTPQSRITKDCWTWPRLRAAWARAQEEPVNAVAAWATSLSAWR